MPLEFFFKKINKCLVEICWSHWRRLGAYVEGPMNYCSTDPEALIVLTSVVGKNDERLLEVTAQWIHFYEHLVPIERMKTLLNKLSYDAPPYPHFSLLRNILRGALEEKQKLRWNSVLKILESEGGGLEERTRYEVESRKKLEGHEKIITNNRQLILRYLFGPVSRADILYCLFVTQNAKKSMFFVVSASQLAQHLHYNRSNIHLILKDLEDGSIVKKIKRPVHKAVSSYTFSEEFILGIESEIKEKAYIDWSPIAFIALELNRLENKFAGLKNETILKVEAQQTLENILEKISMMAAYSYVPPLPQEMLPRTLEHVKVEDLMKRILKIVENILLFVTTQ